MAGSGVSAALQVFSGSGLGRRRLKHGWPSGQAGQRALVTSAGQRQEGWLLSALGWGGGAFFLGPPGLDPPRRADE